MPAGAMNAAMRHDSVRTQARDLWNNVQSALVGVAAAQIKDYISDLLPGFDDHYRRAEQRTAAAAPSLSGTTG